jgi:hypothetical protein
MRGGLASGPCSNQHRPDDSSFSTGAPPRSVVGIAHPVRQSRSQGTPGRGLDRQVNLYPPELAPEPGS